MANVIHPVILCGGTGTRLWPASRAAYPKQFAPLLGSESLYQMTLRRLSGASGYGYAPPLVVTGDAFRFLATDQAVSLGVADARVVVEPTPRDTAPAILTAALMLEPDALMLVAPSDHLLGDAQAFHDAVAAAASEAVSGRLVTFGVRPDRAETGYGYLELAQWSEDGVPAPLASFCEKPDVEAAAAMLASGRHLWNAGLFLMRAGDAVAAFEAHAPDLLIPCRTALEEGVADLDFFRLGPAYAEARAISLDYAVMEPAAAAGKVAVVSLDATWSDLGAWDALWQASPRDESGVATSGEATAIECRDSYLRSESEGLRLVGVGLENIVAVAMRDAVLVADMRAAQGVKRAVVALKEAGAAQAEAYPRVHRPWGWYETLCLGGRFQVKRIMVRPGGVLSLQSHMHRAEHWVVVEGTAQVTVGSEDRLVSENQSVYIPLGQQHRLANPGRLPMYLIEVQTGAYLGEDDIARHEDAYGRS